MSISIGSNLPYTMIQDNTSSVSKSSLENKLSADMESKGDEELMDVCKEFESYLVEQVFKEMKKSVETSEEENKYTQYFGDMMVEQYAKNATETGDLGIAKMLYESMKRN